MSPKQRHTLPKKLEIITVSYEIGLLRTEKLYDVTKKTILSWRKKYQQAGSAGLVNKSRAEHKNSKVSDCQKKAITELCHNQPQISGRTIIENLKLDCSIKSVLKIRNKITADKSMETITDSWIFSYLKLPCTINSKPVYLLTATEKKSGITLFCTTEENIPVYLNAFVEHILMFLHSVGENSTISIETNSSRFFLKAKLSDSKYISNSIIGYRKKPLLIPEYFRKKIRTFPAYFSSQTDLLHFLGDIFFVYNIEQIRQNINRNPMLLLHQSTAITIESNKTCIINKNMEQVLEKIISLIEGEIAKFNLTEAKNLLNYLIRFNSFEHKSIGLQIKIQILLAETQLNSYDYKKAFYHYNKSLKMAMSLGNFHLIIKSLISLANYYLHTSQYRKCEKSLQQALKQNSESSIKHSEGEILYKLGQLYQIISDNRAYAITEQLLEISFKDDNKELFCKAMNLMTVIYFADGFYKKGLSCALKSLKLASKYNYQQAVFEANYNISEYGLRTDNNKLTEKHLLLNMKDSIDHESYTPDDVKNQLRLGLIKCALKDTKNGFQLIEKCLSLSKKRGDRFSESMSFDYLAQAYIYTNSYKKAIFYLNKAAKINEQIGSKDQQIGIYCNLTDAYLQIGQIKKSIFYCYKKIEAVKHTRNRVYLASSYGQLAAAAANNNEDDTAIKYFQMQLKTLKSTDADMSKFFPLANIGTIYLHKKEYKQAQSYFTKAQKKLIALDRDRDLDRIYYDLATIAKATGKIKKMQEYAKLAKEKAMLLGNTELVEQIDLLLNMKP